MRASRLTAPALLTCALAACGQNDAARAAIVDGADASAPAPAQADDAGPSRAPRDGGAEGANADASSATGIAPYDACPDPDAHPRPLACTGLYARWPSLRLADDVRAYDPGLHFWSDGATKRRFIWLPPGKLIDTSDMNEWVFPAGTKLWKEFSLDGHKVETRYLHKRDDGTWERTTFVWNDQETQALELTVGKTNVRGTTYEIPSQDDCTTCHQGRKDGVLGFEAIALSTPEASGVTMHALIDAGLLTNPPDAPLAIPGDATARAALGWLHTNCGVACHNDSPSALAKWTGLRMRLEAESLATVEGTDTYATAVGVESLFQPIEGERFFRIAPRDLKHSAIPYRDGFRDDPAVPPDDRVQMPPIGTHVVDAAGLQLVESWIGAM